VTLMGAAASASDDVGAGLLALARASDVADGGEGGEGDGDDLYDDPLALADEGNYDGYGQLGGGGGGGSHAAHAAAVAASLPSTGPPSSAQYALRSLRLVRDPTLRGHQGSGAAPEVAGADGGDPIVFAWDSSLEPLPQWERPTVELGRMRVVTRALPGQPRQWRGAARMRDRRRPMARLFGPWRDSAWHAAMDVQVGPRGAKGGGGGLGVRMSPSIHSRAQVLVTDWAAEHGETCRRCLRVVGRLS
jgi:hypothetical protein